MPRNFGVRSHERFRDFWNGPTQDTAQDVIWPYFVIGAAVVAVIAVGIFA